ncbi:MAG TPA: hypothetical protein VNM90_26820 [Haliangium sp.]|nr:hypothetical protein [Haliangium sp.]
MSLTPLAALYAAVGAGCVVAYWAALGRTATSAGRRRVAVADAVLLGLLWPLYGPFLLMRGDEDARADGPGALSHARPEAREVAFLGALRRARQTPLGAVLPDEATARALAQRLRVAAAKVTEIDGLLAQPVFDEDDVRRRLDELTARAASEWAVATARMRLQNIHRLRALRHRFAAELDEVGELLVQLTTQAEVLRLAGPAASPGGGPGGSIDASGDPAELVRELVSRVEGLDQMLDDGPHLLDAR